MYFYKLFERGMLREEYHYIIANLGIKEINFHQFIYSGVNITGFHVSATESGEFSAATNTAPPTAKKNSYNYGGQNEQGRTTSKPEDSWGKIGFGFLADYVRELRTSKRRTNETTTRQPLTNYENNISVC